MAESFSSIINSRTFTFLVGEDEKPVIVHEGAIAPLSPSLAGLLQGKMSESVNAKAMWKDVNPTVFDAIVQFAYTGDYSVPVLVLEKQEEHCKPDSDAEVYEEPPQDAAFAQPAEDEWFFPSKKEKKRAKERASQVPIVPFKSRDFPILEPRSRFAASCDPTSDWGSPGSVCEVLMFHVSLYVLGDKWAVDGLLRLSLSKLHGSLILLELNRSIISGLVELMRHAYLNTADREPLDALRELICHFVTTHAVVMSKHESFTELLEEGGAFARDVWKYLVVKG